MISEFAQRLSQEFERALPLLGTLLPKQELQTIIQSTASKMNLVSREEFDAQAAVLQRTRSRLEALEQQLAALEEKAGISRS